MDNPLALVFAQAWDVLSMSFTLYGHTFSFSQVLIFSGVTGAAIWAVGWLMD